MPLATGEKLGPYEILSPIGAGGMGEVYLARDTRLGREVALKISAAQFTERFEREARAVAALNHPNVCTLHDVGPNYLVMEYVEGATLGERIKEGAIPLEEALKLATQIAEALEAAHDKGITHRDLKPGNIKIKPDGTVKVLDFGLAKVDSANSAVQSENSPTLSMAATRAGMILGTAAYMAPEQAKGKSVDRRADIWAFGVVLYEMVTGHQPFHSDDVSETLAAVIMKEPDFTPVPARLQRALKRCLQKDPKKRLRDISGFQLLLEEAPPVAAEKTPVPASGHGRSITIATAAAAGVLAIAFGALAFVHFREQTPERQVLQYALAAPEKAKNVSQFAVSPDGHWLVMRAQGESARQLWLRPMDSLQAQPLAGTENATYPFWSPDSRYVAFFADSKLKKISVSGGPAQPLCDAPSGRGGTWSKDGLILFAPANGGGLSQVPAAGGVPLPVTKTDVGSHRNPVFLPDRRHFLYVGNNVKDSGVYLGSLDSSETRRLFLDVSRAEYFEGHILFVRGGTLMAQSVDPRTFEAKGDLFPVAPDQISVGANNGDFLYSASANGILIYQTGGAGAGRQLQWFDRTGKPGELVGGVARITEFSLAPDGRRVATARQADDLNHEDIWITDPEHHTESRITFDASRNVFPTWSPDGTKIAFASNRRGGVFNLYQRASNGTGQDQLLLESKLPNAPWDWSRDGRFLLFVNVDPKTHDDIFALPMTGQAGDKKPIAAVHSDFEDRASQLSPDGRWLAYTSNESGRYEVYVVPFAVDAPKAPSGKWQISTAGGIQPRWKSDGKEIYYMSLDRKLMAADIRMSGPNFEHGTPQVLFDSHADNLAAGATSWAYAVSADGKRFLISVAPGAVGEAAPLTVVVNWLGSVKK